VNELTEYRKQLIDRLEAAAKEFRTAALTVKDPFASIEEGGWNVHQLAVHTRDVDRLVYGLRTRRTLEEDNPEFPNFDGTTHMAEKYDRREPLGDVLDGLLKNVGEQVELLHSMPVEGWSRLSRHATQGSGLTLQMWVERGVEHLEEHLATIKKVGEE
jgi:DinB superfamily